MSMGDTRIRCRLQAGWLLVGGIASASCGAGPNPAEGRTHEIQSAPFDGTPVVLRISVGDVAPLSSPPIVMHPDFAGARIVAEYDNERLVLVDRKRDMSRLGQTVEIFQFRALSMGTVEVVLRLSGTAKPVQRITRYRLEIGG